MPIVVRPPIRRRGQNWLPLSRSSTRAEKTGSGGVVVGGSALISLAVPSVDSEVTFLWDFDNDGDYDEDVEDFTSYVLQAESLIGRDFASQLNGKATPGKLRITCRNDDDRFSYFNAASPLATAPFSLKSGRRVRVRANEAVDSDPTLLARDRFNRANFNAGLDTGQAWNIVSGPFTTEATSNNPPNNIGGADATSEGSTHLAVVDVGVADYYAQVRLARLGRDTGGRDANEMSLVYRYQDSNDYSLLRAYPLSTVGVVELVDVVAGVETIFAAELINVYDDLTIGVHVVDDEVTAYVEGVAILSGTAVQTDETEVGILALPAVGQAQPVFDDFEVWSGLPAEIEGVLWTGEITVVNPSVEAGPHKLAVIEAQGVLAKLSSQQVTPPKRTVTEITPTGHIVGEVLAKAGQLSPPGGISSGDVLTGPVFFTEPTVEALGLARAFEETEFGFLYETQEGGIGFQGRTDRDAESSVVTFSDNPGAQFGYTSLDPKDWRREIINRVFAKVAPRATSSTTVFIDSNSTALNVRNRVRFNLPTLEAGDLLITIIASTVAPATGDDGGEKWLTPIWWVNERNVTDVSFRMRIYSHISGGDDSGDLVTFYSDVDANGGSWIAHTYLFTDWYGSHAGIHVVPPAPGSSPPLIIPPWGNEPTAFIAARHLATSVNGAHLSGNVTAPEGFHGIVSTFENGAVNGFDVGLQSAERKDNLKFLDPEVNFTGSGGFVSSLIESVTIAVRGYNGDYPESGAPGDLLAGTAQPSGAGIIVQRDDLTSQEDHNQIITPRTIPAWFASVDDAETYADLVIDRYSDDRPIFSLTFIANKGAHYRAQALRRRVNDRITLRADANSGMGVNGDFFIEAISHRWSNGTKLWEVTWDLSPAPEGVQALLT